MPWSRPPLATLITRIAADIQAQMGGVNALLRRALLTIVGRTTAGAVHGLYGHQEVIANNTMVDVCDDTVFPRWAAILGTPQKQAAFASGPVALTGSNGTVPAGTVLTRSDNTEYTTNADATLVAGAALVSVTASVAAADGDCLAGMTLNFASPVAGVSSVATVAAPGISGGADVELLDAWRARALLRLQQPPRAGTKEDYVEWALDVPGVTRAWCYPRELGIGGVTVRFVMDNAPGGIIPDAATLAAVQTYLNSVCPVDATPVVVSPSLSPLNYTIHLVNDSAAIRAAVTANLADLHARNAIPGGTLLLSDIDEAIKTSAGVTDFVLTAPAGNVVEPTGLISSLGVITWV